MSKIHSNHNKKSEGELLPVYRFNYKKARPNRFAIRHEIHKPTVLALDEDERGSGIYSV